MEVITWFGVQAGVGRLYHASWEGTALCEREAPLPLNFYHLAVLPPGCKKCDACNVNVRMIERRQKTPRDQWEAQKPAAEPLEPGSRG